MDTPETLIARLEFLADLIQTRMTTARAADDSARPAFEIDMPTRELDATVMALRDAAHALSGATPVEYEEHDDGNFTVGGEPWTDEQIKQMRATAVKLDMRNARELLEANGYTVTPVSPTAPEQEK